MCACFQAEANAFKACISHTISQCRGVLAQVERGPFHPPISSDYAIRVPLNRAKLLESRL